jgi:hypothetical protein
MLSLAGQLEHAKFQLIARLHQAKRSLSENPSRCVVTLTQTDLSAGKVTDRIV